MCETKVGGLWGVSMQGVSTLMATAHHSQQFAGKDHIIFQGNGEPVSAKKAPGLLLTQRDLQSFLRARFDG
jgi:hypothetical protein